MFFVGSLLKDGYDTVVAAASSWNVKLKMGSPLIPNNLFRKLDKTGNVPPGMVRVTGAQTRFGKLDDFFIDKYEVTNRQYKEFIDKGGYRNKKYWKNEFIKDGKTLTWEEAMKLFVDQTGRPGPSTWQAGDYPMVRLIIRSPVLAGMRQLLMLILQEKNYLQVLIGDWLWVRQHL